MMKKISLFLVVVLLGCQDVITPSSPSMTEVDDKISDSELSTGSLKTQGLLTTSDSESLLTELRREGYNLSQEELNYLLLVIEVGMQTYESLEREMPQSLQNTKEPWSEIIKRDPEAEAFVLKLKKTFEENLTGVQVPPTIDRCHDQVQWPSGCINDFKLLCRFGDCLDAGHIFSLIACLLSGGCYPTPDPCSGGTCD